MRNAAERRRAMIAKVKIAQQQLGMDDTAYRALLVRVTGKTSCADCKPDELDRLLAEFARLGFAPKSKTGSKRPYPRGGLKAMMGKIEALLLDNGWSWNYAQALGKKMFGVERLQWLSEAQLHKVVAALQIHANRLKGGRA